MVQGSMRIDRLVVGLTGSGATFLNIACGMLVKMNVCYFYCMDIKIYYIKMLIVGFNIYFNDLVIVPQPSLVS